MTEQETKALSSTEDEIPPSEESRLPLKLKVTLALVFGIPALVILILLGFSMRQGAKASELGLGPVLLFCLGALAVILIPWDTLGLRLTKVGFLEFSQVIRTQKKEQSESIAFLQEQIDALKQETEANKRVSEVEQWITPPSHVLPNLLIRFLRNYRGQFFSPTKINKWGAEQPGFRELASYSKEEISQALGKMLSENQVRTQISERGNTLYGISRRSRLS
jgi:hypothetical protein